jgi:hypothetical protein
MVLKMIFKNHIFIKHRDAKQWFISAKTISRKVDTSGYTYKEVQLEVVILYLRLL